MEYVVQSTLLALSGHCLLHCTCPLLGKADMAVCRSPLSRSLSGVKQTWVGAPHMSAFDPKRTWDHRPTRFVSLTAQDFPRGRWAHCRDRIGYLRTGKTGCEQRPPGAKRS